MHLHLTDCIPFEHTAQPQLSFICSRTCVWIQIGIWSAAWSPSMYLASALEVKSQSVSSLKFNAFLSNVRIRMNGPDPQSDQLHDLDLDTGLHTTLSSKLSANYLPSNRSLSCIPGSHLSGRRRSLASVWQLSQSSRLSGSLHSFLNLVDACETSNWLSDTKKLNWNLIPASVVMLLLIESAKATVRSLFANT